jgi:hypothetical protein
MKVIISSEERLIEVAEQAIKIIANLRKYTKLWEQTHGCELRNRKKYWEGVADGFVRSLELPELKQNDNYKIEINENSTGS